MRRVELARMVLIPLLLSLAAAAQERKKPESKEQAAILWQDPGDIRSKDLFYGLGGKKDLPQPPLTFTKEDLKGHNPKFDAEDRAGRKWRVKMGPEAHAEPVASRLLWAIGYGANENYFLPDIEVEKLPPKLHRGQEFVTSPDHVKGVRLQRREKKDGEWDWQHNPFLGTREFNGLRVMMALLNNWDLKDENNAIFRDPDSGKEIYEVTDVGTAFGTPGKRYRDETSKNNLPEYRRAKFISKIAPDYVNFNCPHRPPGIAIVLAPKFYFHEVHMRWVGEHVPRADAKWVGSLLAQLSHQQIRDAFRAGGYPPEQVEAFAAAVEARIAELNRL